MNTTPSCALDTKAILANARSLVPMIREQANAIEMGRRLPAPLLEAMSDAGSGSLHATHLTGGCLVLKDGQPIMEDDGYPRWRVMIFDPAEVEILDTWYTTGLAGSGSNDYSVSDTFVPDQHTFHALGTPMRSEPLYRYHGFFFANVPGIPFGMARAALDEARDVAASKQVYPPLRLLREDAQVQTAFGEAEATLGAARAYVTDVMGAAWEKLGA